MATSGFDERWLVVLIPGFLVAFAMLWTLVIGVISRLGWARLADRYGGHTPPSTGAKRIGGQSISVGSGWLAPNYGNCITAWLDHDGIFLRPMLLFRPFHPMLRIRWADVLSVEEASRMVLRRLRLTPKGDLPSLILTGRLAAAVNDAWQRAPRNR